MEKDKEKERVWEEEPKILDKELVNFKKGQGPKGRGGASRLGVSGEAQYTLYSHFDTFIYDIYRKASLGGRALLEMGGEC